MTTIEAEIKGRKVDEIAVDDWMTSDPDTKRRRRERVDEWKAKVEAEHPGETITYAAYAD